MKLTINGIPNNGYTMNDIRYPQGTTPQRSVYQSLFQGKPVSALIDEATIWPQGSRGTIKIQFDPSEEGAYSYVGKISSYGNPSMVYGFLDPPLTDFEWNDKTYPLSLFKYDHRNGCANYGICEKNFKPGAVVLHEFMHALGGSHEHQNAKNSPLVFNEAEIYRSYCGTTNPPIDANCRKTADFNVLSLYTCYDSNRNTWDKECYSYSDFDPDSILLYNLYDNWIAEGYENPTKYNYRLSASDMAWLKDYYPIDSDRKPIIEVTFLNGEEWQKAWVQKIISEYLAPYVGVKFVWPGMDLVNPPINYVTETNITLPPTEPPTDGSPPTTKPTESPLVVTSTDEIVGLVQENNRNIIIYSVLGVLGGLLIIGLVMYLVKIKRE